MAGQAHALLEWLRHSSAWSAQLHAEAQLLWAAADSARGAVKYQVGLARSNIRSDPPVPTWQQACYAAIFPICCQMIVHTISEVTLVLVHSALAGSAAAALIRLAIM